jgi:hypothetical protein
MTEEKGKRPKPTEPRFKRRERMPPPGMSFAAQAAFHDQRLLEQGIRAIIATEDVKLVEVVGYYNFGRQAMKRTSKWTSQTSRNDDLAVLIRKWSAQGLKEHILVRILSELLRAGYPTKTATGKKA